MDWFSALASEVPTGIPTGLPGQAIVEEAVRKAGSADSTYAPLLIMALAVIAILGWLLFRSANKRDGTMERVVVAIERANSSVTSLNAMQTSVTALSTAVHDLAREAEGEAKDGRHALANIMQVVSFNSELMKRVEVQTEALKTAVVALQGRIEARRRGAPE